MTGLHDAHPQFVEPMGLLWLTTYVLLVGQLAALLRAGPVRRAIDPLAGAVLVALGLRLAFERR